MYLIYEQDDLPIAVHNLFHDAFQPLFELALVFRPRNQRSEIERIYLLGFQILRNLTINDFLCYTLRYSRLSHTRFTHQDRVVLSPPAQDLEHPADLLIPSYHRIQFALRCPLIEVHCKLFEIFQLIFCHISNSPFRPGIRLENQSPDELSSLPQRIT